MMKETSANTSWVTKSSKEYRNKICAYCELKEGWNYGEGMPIKNQTISIALDFAEFSTSKLLCVDSIPCLNGEIQLALYKTKNNPKKYLEVTLTDFDDINITKYVNDGATWNIEYDLDFTSKEEAFNQIISFKNELYACPPHTSEYYRKNNFSHIPEDSAVVPLKTIKAGYQPNNSATPTTY